MLGVTLQWTSIPSRLGVGGGVEMLLVAGPYLRQVKEGTISFFHHKFAVVEHVETKVKQWARNDSSSNLWRNLDYLNSFH